MNITLTGATGFIGARLIQRFQAGGDAITLLGRHAPESPNLRFFPWDATSSEPPAEALEGSDAIIHLAGEPVAQRWNDEVKQRILESRRRGTRHLVQALSTIRSRPGVLVSASAIGYYGDRGDEILTEQSPPGNGFLADVCMEWESQARLAESLGIRVAFIRNGIVLGRDGGALKQMLPPFRLGAGGPIAGGKQWMSWIHLTDLVELIHTAVQNNQMTGPINGTSPEPVRNADFTRALAEVLHRPAVVPVPAFGLKLLFGEMASVMLASQRVLPEAAKRAGFRFQYTELKSALEDVA